MRPLRLLLFVLLTGAACAPARPAPPAPTPPAASPDTAPDAEAPPSADAPATPVTGDGPAAAWWMADTDAAAPGAGVARAYRELLAGRAPERTVVIGIIDSGIETSHEDLDDNLWVNDDEIAGNQVDDDGNGYVDDVHGWNFIGGPDGRHVNRDTYEETRLFARCRSGGTIEGVAGAPGGCAEIEASFRQSVVRAESQLEEIRGLEQTVDRVEEILRRELQGDSLDEKSVRALTPLRQDAMQARGMYLQLAELDITPQMIRDERQRLEDRLRYGLNPDFDPRAIVGDDFTDAHERGYGNPDVVGPGAGHGTGVAGIIAAERDNGIGEDGIAPSARIMALRAVPDGDERDKDVANAIRYAVDNGAHIINMSFGKAHSPRKSVVDEAVRYAVANGVLLIHAAGNAGSDLTTEPSFPTRRYAEGGVADTWIEVGASDWQGPDRLAAPFSNYGRTVDVFAPGVDIRTTDIGNDFQVNSGTSFAAPVVSGLAALIMAYYPELSAAEVRRIILDSATPFAETSVVRPGGDPNAPPVRVPFGDLSATGGIVNAYAALRMAEQATR